IPWRTSEDVDGELTPAARWAIWRARVPRFYPAPRRTSRSPGPATTARAREGCRSVLPRTSHACAVRSPKLPRPVRPHRVAPGNSPWLRLYVRLSEAAGPRRRDRTGPVPLARRGHPRHSLLQPYVRERRLALARGLRGTPRPPRRPARPGRRA